MLKKLLIGVLVVGLSGVLIAGVVNRTLQKSTQTAQAQGYGRGQDGQTNAAQDDHTARSNQTAAGQGQGRAQNQDSLANTGQGRNAQDNQSNNARGGPNAETHPAEGEATVTEWLTFEGSVVQLDADALTVQATDGSQLIVGHHGWSFALEQGFSAQIGDQVSLRGFYEGEDFEVGQIQNLTSGQEILLRDEGGRPMWAGRNAQNNQSNDARGGPNAETHPAEGEATTTEWLTFAGSVVQLDADALTVQATDGSQLIVGHHGWSFALEQGFSAQIGDQVSLRGFYEGEDFEVGQIQNLTSGQEILLRDEGGRPMWAGRWRRGA